MARVLSFLLSSLVTVWLSSRSIEGKFILTYSVVLTQILSRQAIDSRKGSHIVT